MMKQLTILLLLIFSASLSFAQIGVAKVVEKNGKKYYEHKVKKGQTAYGISQMYETTVSVLFENNPEAESGLQIGQELYIPVANSSSTDNPIKVTDESESLPHEGDKNESTSIADTNQIIHVVQSGETMYGIAKKYGVSVEDLKAANGNASVLNIGQKLIIPVDKADKTNEDTPIVKDPINTSVAPGDSVILHEVKKGDTFYSLSKLYEVDGQSIRDANDGLPKGLQLGETIRIVVKKKVQIENIASEPVIHIVYDSTTRVEKVYDIAIMLPFMLDENDKFRANCPPVGDCPFYGYTMMAINLERGIMMAIDSLQKAGLSVNVHVYDTEKDTAEVSKILSKPEMNQMDLIFGPLYPRQIKMVAEFAKEHKIQNVIPVPVSNKALYQNPYLSKYVTSTPTQVVKLGEYVADRFPMANVIAIKNKADKQDSFYFDEFVKSYNSTAQKNPFRLNNEVLTTEMSSSSKLTAVETKLHDTALNIIVVPSQDLGHVSNFVTKLVATSNRNPYSNYKYMIVGLEDWIGFETIDEKYKSRFNLNVVSSSFIDYNDPKINKFVKDFRSEYGIDPDKYAINGFDAAFTNLSGLLLYGTAYAQNYKALITDGFASGSSYKAVEQGSGYENQAVYFLEYNDYRVTIVEKK
ncbi:MAG: LysM peptidoglycan-binding domain-containing protein [Flavobacteriales bacterium]|nr:LysM peptidoglycan-binding domain-containing protein [Flavobacteriales bacterium]MCB9198340.1 LysM peptidoglycan-binding domain-containing protein [Flavobacteriales bacterium]